ncbi:hypothetical protein AVEN_43929-1, partial [Araneus ventricosus]
MLKPKAHVYSFLRQNQEDLRIELYRGLLDALECRAHNENIRTGKLIILPSSSQGSPRHTQKNYQDAMAMVRKFGKPDLFLTFTCNPSWSEILNSMEGVQRPEDRPDIIVRVFNMKLKELLEDICKHGIFGTVLANTLKPNERNSLLSVLESASSFRSVLQSFRGAEYWERISLLFVLNDFA